MTRKILWVVVSFLLVASLVLASCAKEEEVTPGEQEEEEEVVTPGEQEEEEEVITPAAGEPQYGGSLTVVLGTLTSLGYPNIAYGTGSGNLSNYVMEKFYLNDLEKYGVRGTGECDFTMSGVPPLRFFKGGLAESWEVTPDKIVFHIRPGVYWTGLSINPVMEKREFTADDFAFNEYRRWSDPLCPGYAMLIAGGKDWIKDIYALDKYTAVIETSFFHGDWHSILTASMGFMMAPENFEAGHDKWENLVGTGAFYVKAYVYGSHLTLGRNPDYWGTTTINGKEYQLPFIDELVFPLIGDATTATAALRTATVDAYTSVPMTTAVSLAKTNPDLLSFYQTWTGSTLACLRCDQPPFNNREVRRALFIGTNRDAISAMLLQPGGYHRVPIAEWDEGWIPIEELPASAQELYTYDPVKAKQMLADAGFPNGFAMNILTRTDSQFPEIAEMLADMWEKLGIKVTINTGETSVVRAKANKLAFQDCYLDAGGWGYSPLQSVPIFFSSWATRPWCAYSNEYVDSRLKAAIQEFDTAKRVALLEEVFVRIIDDAPVISLSSSLNVVAMTWPWVKNYYGETNFQFTPDIQNWWLDADLRAKMGYK